ncbi:TonB-dependent siderophore receptor [Oxalobacteraceae bacterium R-40]|uniref:TonB-dependent siderophore receptor n=1 Tax=Keguizhuia sedimenti TaxID=3064264 RepID=A0ABU1BPU3_9BURK|nr:TonB-dependent siderophore receptor [Oxalobacteraceae bacterium R-40]
MSSPNIRYSLIAYSIAQAFALSSPAFAQTASNALPEIVVTATGQNSVKANTASVGGFSDAPLLQTPASISVYTQQQMQDQGIRSTTDVVRFDASLNEDYNAIGYAEQFSIRGFRLDNFSSYRKDGLPISSDASIPLENKERIEVLKGLAGLQAGIATPGGIINYVTKRPAAVRSATVGASERGTLYSAADLGGFSDDKQFGYRINAAAEKLRSYVRGADGERTFVSGAFDWRLSPKALLALDLDYQHKSQVTAAGYQLIGGTDLPRNVDPKRNLNDQPWTRPVDTDSANIGLRFDYQLDANWKTSLAANWHQMRRDDFAAFPAGCSSGPTYLYPGFCANGDFDLYDYKSENEEKSVSSLQAMVQGKFATGAIRHELTAGVSALNRRDHFGDFVYDFVGIGNASEPVEFAEGSALESGPTGLRRHDRERALFVQDIIGLTDAWKLHAGLRYVETKRDQYDAADKFADYEKSHVLPNVALVYSPQANWSVYGSYAEGLEHGGIAPLFTANENEVLNPSKSKQLEFGIKADLSRDLSVSAALFEIKKPHEYTEFNSFTYIRSGDAVHRGLELAAQGRAGRNLQLGASLALLDTETRNTDDPNIEGKRAGNVPEVKAAVYADYALSQVPGLSVNGNWLYTGNRIFVPNSATRVKVPDYNVFNAGARYVTKVAGQTTTLRFNINNVFDKFYWRDASSQLDGYLLPGAPRTFSLTAQMEF